MTKKKNKFVTFCFSLIPGAGEMYLGFFKHGISNMLLFFLLTGVAGFLNLSILMYLSPVVWFYSFFYTHNLNSLPDDEFFAMEDNYVLDMDFAASTGNNLLTKHRRSFAVLLIFLGISILWNMINDFLLQFLRQISVPDYVYASIRNLSDHIPQGLVAVAIIMAGYYLIKNKKETLDREDTGHRESEHVYILEDTQVHKDN